MRKAIIEKLKEVETVHGVEILYACESGSRAWGFASTDSDYDVRFIYKRRLEDYLSIRERREVIELPVNEVLDIGGWDIRKALQLFLKSNAPLYEWLQSPVIYEEKNGFAKELRQLMPSYFSFRAGCHHYLSMGRNTFENDLQGGQVRLKKYFYALRPLLAALWIIQKESVPPMQFGELRQLITNTDWQDAVDRLLEQKKMLDEKATISPVAMLQQWIGDNLATCADKANRFMPLSKEVTELDSLFGKYIKA
jgi:predicted nucleotidyltransferase